jgi:cytochrome c-type biogenesis protein CcmH
MLLGSPAGIEPSNGVASVDDMVSSLADRLQDEPDDVVGWKMLGRSYFELERYEESADAFGRAVELESGSDGQTLADLGQALLMFEPDSINGQAGQLFESSLALSPTNAKALFYGGMAAINRGDGLLGADRWEKLLETSPPPQNVEELLRTRIAILRGETQSQPAPVVAESAPLLTVRVELGEHAAMAVNGDATVFLIARDPNQPSPPIAAIRRKAAELPAEITLSDADAMIPGRVPSAFAELEIVARASVSGNPIAQSGDWFGTARIDKGDDEVLAIQIDQQVP